MVVLMAEWDYVIVWMRLVVLMAGWDYVIV